MSTCNVDVRWFPFDIQQCELKFGSWTFDGWLLDLQMNEADISGYMPNGEWDLVGECVETTSLVSFSLSSERNTHRQIMMCALCCCSNCQRLRQREVSLADAYLNG